MKNSIKSFDGRFDQAKEIHKLKDSHLPSQRNDNKKSEKSLQGYGTTIKHQ
jgi:hypothetical protein